MFIFPYKSSWDYCKKWECNFILSQYKISFQALDLKRKNFLELFDSNLKPIKLLAIKGGPWLQYFGYSNLLYARATRAIINHTSISEYYLRFSPREDFLYLCSLYPMESRWYILHDCKRFNKYWNPRKNTIAYFLLFLQFNSNAFSFD